VKTAVAGDLLDRAGSAHQTLGRQFPSNLIFQPLQRRAFFEEATVQGAE